jgi:acyl-CoA synthetase (AMP-forming)/AMP-acid ligase II
MNYPTPQAASSATFKAPPIDGSLSIPEMWEYNRTHSPEHPLFVYKKDGVVKTITWSEAMRATHTAARIVRSKLGPPTEKTGKEPVGILAVAGK